MVSDCFTLIFGLVPVFFPTVGRAPSFSHLWSLALVKMCSGPGVEGLQLHEQTDTSLHVLPPHLR